MSAPDVIDPMRHRADRVELGLLLFVAAVFVWSGISPYDRLTWAFETAPAVIGIVILLVTRARFRFTTLVYGLVAMHCVLLCIGGHFTYSRVPVFEWLQETGVTSRNHFDRLGHVVQGFVPAIIAREILLRNKVVRGRGWLFTIVTALCLGVSVIFELAEAAAGISIGSRAD